MWLDAETLYASGRLGTADHLYGLSAECALKAILYANGSIPAPPTKGEKRLARHIDELWSEYGSALQGHFANYVLDISNPFASWKPHDRYLHDQAFAPHRVAGHQSGARATFALLEAALMDGRL